jgi:hypothetical protein
VNFTNATFHSQRKRRDSTVLQDPTDRRQVQVTPWSSARGSIKVSEASLESQDTRSNRLPNSSFVQLVPLDKDYGLEALDRFRQLTEVRVMAWLSRLYSNHRPSS